MHKCQKIRCSCGILLHECGCTGYKPTKILGCVCSRCVDSLKKRGASLPKRIWDDSNIFDSLYPDWEPPITVERY